MKLEVFDDADAVARAAAATIAADARDAVAARGRFVMAVSGGHTPWIMLRALANEDCTLGEQSTSSRSMSGSHLRAIRTAISLIFVRVCSNMRRSLLSRSMPCPWSLPTWRLRRSNTRRP